MSGDILDVSHLFVQLHQVLLCRVHVLFVVKVLVVVHVPTHFLLIVHGTLRGHVHIKSTW